MRSGLSIILQSLTQEAASILNQSITEARRRTHGQTTPLHVAATLLAAPSGFLRQACIRSHPNSSHPLQCRALELCFSVALERLPTAQYVTPGTEPPISNALMAAIKRAQAHQRRGCPEQQQQPLLAVKVELDQLIISILDDPSVSRVMREASFSSPAVKAAIEQHQQHLLSNSNPFMQIANPNPRPRFRWGTIELNRVLEVMARSRRRNPILVGDGEPEAVVRELLRKIERQKDLGNDVVLLKNVTVVSMENLSSVVDKMKELEKVIESRIMSGGVVVHLGDLKWLVEQPETWRTVVVVVEMSKLLARFRRDGGGDCNKFWLIGTATCETYLRCQVYHSTMENDWDIQALPMASRSSPLPARMGTERLLLSSPVEPLTPIRPAPTPPLAIRRENIDPVEKNPFCPQCCENYEKEVAKLSSIQNSFSEASLPPWLQNAKLNATDAITQGKGNSLLPKKTTQELQKKWKDTCLHLHQNNRAARLASPTRSTMHTPNLLTHPDFQPKLQTTKPLGQVLRLDTYQSTQSPVRTDLVLGRRGVEKAMEDGAKDLLGCISSEQTKTVGKFPIALDADMYKKLLKGLMEKAWWQGEAAPAVASAITRCTLGNGKHRGDVWLLFTGPDRVGKKKMATVIAEQVCGASPVIICLGTRREDEEEFDMTIRGTIAIDRIAEAVRRNPCSVVMLQDIDEADMLARGNIKRAIEQGRIADSHGREVGLGNAIFIVTGNWSTAVDDCEFIDEASGKWQLRLVVREKTSKRRGSWIADGRQTRPRKEVGLSLDLNLAIISSEVEDDGSLDSSEVTMDHDVDCSFSVMVPHDLVNNVDGSIAFKPVNRALVRREIRKRMSMMVDESVSLEVEDDVLEKMLGGLWHDETSLGEWIEKVLKPSLDELKPRLLSSRSLVVVESETGRSNSLVGDWLPSRILV